MDGKLHLRNIPGFSMDLRIFAGIGAWALDFHRNWDWNDPNFGNFTTLPGTYQWQKTVGYNWWYDWFFNAGGPIKKLRFPFIVDENTNDETHYIIWCWKADYWNMGAGAEIGIYYQTDPDKAAKGYYNIDTDNLLVDVLMNVYYYPDGVGNPSQVQQITTNFTQTNWWITSFTPHIQKVQMDQLVVNLKVNFAGKENHIGLMAPFYDEFFGKERDGLSWGATVNIPGRILYCGHHPTLCSCGTIEPCQKYTDYEFYIDY